jgi:hypothetical protein
LGVGNGVGNGYNMHNPGMSSPTVVGCSEGGEEVRSDITSRRTG